MNKVIIVGASSGIGRELALVFAENNYRVAVTGRRENLLKEVQGIHPDKIIYHSYDVSTAGNIEHLNSITESLGGLDILVYSSGFGEANPDLDFNIERTVNDVNISGFTETVGWAFNYFRNQGGGRIAVITSIAGLRGLSTGPAYSASKAYQINYLEGLRRKARKEKLQISVTDAQAGYVDTAMAKGRPLFWVSPPRKAAEQIFMAVLKKRRIVYVTKRWRLVAYIVKGIPSYLIERV